MTSKSWLAVLFVAGCASGEPLVKSSLGTISGKSETFGDAQVESFLGIPYAKPPIGELRFTHPKAFGPVGDLNASQFSATCIQTKIRSLPPTPESEDCLYLNILRRAGTQQDSKKAVLFVIHGGAFCSGSASFSYYSGLPMAAIGDVIVVTLNYRLGVLGFADMKELAPGNLGLYDQLLALEWVRDNIAAFGGDPDNVTLYGLSAGSMAASAILNTPLVRNKKLFRNIILDAGVMARSNVMTQEESLQRVKLLAGKVGCDTDGEKMLSCLRGVNATQLAEQSFDPEFSRIYTFLPSIDGKFVSMEPSKDIRENADKFPEVRMMIGFAKNEGTLFVEMYGDAAKALKTKDDFVAICERIAKQYLHPIDVSLPEVRDAVVEAYFGKSADHFNDAAEFLADGSFNCPTNGLAKGYAKTHGNIYVFFFERLFRSVLYGRDPKTAGAFHGSPFGHMFGSALASPNQTLDAEDRQFILDTVKTVADFVKSDNVPELRGVQWPNYSKDGGVLVIDDKVTVRAGLAHEERCRKVFFSFEA